MLEGRSSIMCGGNLGRLDGTADMVVVPCEPVD
jgi:hypothetical protein